MEREELHRCINLFQEKLKEGNIIVPSHLIEGFQQSIKNIRCLSDGMIDPDTVDSGIRVLCGMVIYEQEQERLKWMKVAPLKEIQKGFFQRVERFFGRLFEDMIKKNEKPHMYAAWILLQEDKVKKDMYRIDEFLEEINKFWEKASYPTWLHLEDSHNSKAVFTGGGTLSEGISNITCSTGLYFDTTILPDPFVEISQAVKIMDNRVKFYQILYLALQILSYKSLSAVEMENPIVVILPDRRHLGDYYKDSTHEITVNNSIEHTKTLFGQNIKDEDELCEYYSHFKDGDEIVSKLHKPDKLVIAADWDVPLPVQLAGWMGSFNLKKVGIENAGQALLWHIRGKFSEAHEAFQRSRQLKGTPIIRDNTSWFWYKQMLELNAKDREQNSLNDFHIARALNSKIKNEMPWMGNIPSDALIEMRQTGALEEIRHVLSSGIKDIVEANPSNFNKTGDKVFDNLDKAFKMHEKKIKDLISRRWSFAGKDLGSFVVVGGIEITAALTGLSIWGVATGMAGMSGVVPSAKEVINKYKQLKTEGSEINNTGVGMLFKNKTKVK